MCEKCAAILLLYRLRTRLYSNVRLCTKYGFVSFIYYMRDMSHLAHEAAVDLEGPRERLRKMSEAELLRFGKAAKFMCSPEANRGKPPRECFVIQLNEARKEWLRRHPKAA